KGINGSYRPLLHFALGRPYLTLGFAAALFIASCMLFKVVGFGLFPRSEKPMFLINIETPLGTSLDKTDSVARFVEKELRLHPDIQTVFSNTGKGNPAVYYNQAQHSEAANFAQLFIRLHPLEVPEMERLVDTLRARFDHYPDAKIEVKQFEQGPLQEAPIAIRLFGDNLDTLRSLSARVEELMHRTPGTIYVNNPLQTYKTDIHLQLNKDKAALLGIQTSDIDRMVRMGVAGLNIAQYKDEKGDNYFINLSLPRYQHQTLEALNKIYIPTPTGAMVPLQQLATLEFETSVPQIKHYNKNRYALVTSFVKNGYNTAVTTRQIEAGLQQVQFPGGYSYMMAGEVESSQESFGNLGTIIVITIFAFLGILLLEFRTFKSTLIVLSVIPLGIVGTVGILLITGNTLSFISVIGIIALAGIEVKNSILLVDYTNQLRAGGMGLDEAIQEAGETRFLPIILTTLTAIGGLIPLVLERSPLYSPLAWVLVGGLISSTMLTRLVTPVMYKLLKPAVHHG
ncbi:MAG TPA: efflux RND transporter permease subunit, partial [Chitinophaga sp.]